MRNPVDSGRIRLAVVCLSLVGTLGCIDDERPNGDDPDENGADRTGLIYGYTYLGSIHDGVQVFLIDNDDAQVHLAETVSDTDGYFEFEVPPGIYGLLGTYIASEYYGAPECVDYRFDVEVDADEVVQQDIHLICEDID